MSSDMGTRVGNMLFERVIKIGNSRPWERGLTEKPHLTRDIIKQSILGQTFALLSTDPAHRSLAAAYFGSIISV